MKYSKVLKNALLVLVMLCATQLQAQDVESKIKDLSANKWQWMADKNVNELKDLFHPQAQFVHMGGSWGTDQELNIIKGGGIWYKNADIHSVAVDVIENTAILLNEITLLAEVGGNQVTNRFMVTEVYINEENGWKLANLSFVKLMTGPTRE
ncbi:MAG: nuclear transport factor 2 family protein [Bacteroidota bacterium]|nr:nuclear transport factor 2 family protein [Bacteroidota bacterium]